MRSSAGLVILSAGLAVAAPFWMPDSQVHRHHDPHPYPPYPPYPHSTPHKSSLGGVSSRHSTVHSTAKPTAHSSAHSSAHPSTHSTAHPSPHSSATPIPYSSAHPSSHSSVRPSPPSSQSPSPHSSAHPTGHSSAPPSVSSSAHPYSTGKPRGTTTSKAPGATSSATPTGGSTGTGNGALWQPAVGSSWQIVLSELLDASGTLDPDVEVFDIDMFDTPTSTIKQLQAKGKKVVCYFSAGSYEPGRPDSNQFTSSDLGSVMDGWPDEKWLNIRSTNVRNIMANRIKTAKSKGCDGIDPDNVDGYVSDIRFFLPKRRLTLRLSEQPKRYWFDRR
jgi:hypothetical protein